MVTAPGPSKSRHVGEFPPDICFFFMPARIQLCKVRKPLRWAQPRLRFIQRPLHVAVLCWWLTESDFAVGDDVEIKVNLAMDNRAGRTVGLFSTELEQAGSDTLSLKAFESNQKWGKVSWQFEKLEEHSTSDLGTKRLTRERMEFLMHLCKVYDMSQSSVVDRWGFKEQCQDPDAYPIHPRLEQQDGYGCSICDHGDCPCLPADFDASSDWLFAGDGTLWSWAAAAFQAHSDGLATIGNFQEDWWLVVAERDNIELCRTTPHMMKVKLKGIKTHPWEK